MGRCLFGGEVVECHTDAFDWGGRPRREPYFLMKALRGNERGMLAGRGILPYFLAVVLEIYSGGGGADVRLFIKTFSLLKLWQFHYKD